MHGLEKCVGQNDSTIVEKNPSLFTRPAGTSLAVIKTAGNFCKSARYFPRACVGKKALSQFTLMEARR